MNESWLGCKNILCVRADNMGDLIMSGPAMRALKRFTGAKITVLTSSIAAAITPLIEDIDDTIVYDLPWVKTNGSIAPESFFEIAELLKQKQFDAAVIFSVYSQNPLPASMLCYLAAIPRRLAYCRENPYDLLTNWVPDEEPYTTIKHQVRRDLNLVATIGAVADDEELSLNVASEVSIGEKLNSLGVDINQKWIVIHPCVSEKKREYPVENWTRIARQLIGAHGYQVLFTGAKSEKDLTERLRSSCGKGAFSLAGEVNLREFVELIRSASLVLSVNTGTIHIAAAVKTPVIVLYALTNPQHYPWKAKGAVFPFDVDDELKSRNEVIKFVNQQHFNMPVRTIEADEIVSTVLKINAGELTDIPELPDQLRDQSKHQLC